MKQNLQTKISSTAFAFRGYNITNLGRSPELFASRTYGPIVRSYLRRAGDICAGVTGRRRSRHLGFAV